MDFTSICMSLETCLMSQMAEVCIRDQHAGPQRTPRACSFGVTGEFGEGHLQSMGSVKGNHEGWRTAGSAQQRLPPAQRASGALRSQLQSQDLCLHRSSTLHEPSSSKQSGRLPPSTLPEGGLCGRQTHCLAALPLHRWLRSKLGQKLLKMGKFPEVILPPAA